MLETTKIRPVAEIATDMQCFWVLEQEADIYNREDFMPDSYSELIINVGAPHLLASDDGNTVELPRAYINPLQTKPLRFRVQGFCQIIAMRLYPWAIQSLLNVQSAPNAVNVIPLDSDWQNFAAYLTQVVQHYGYQEAVNRLQDRVCNIANCVRHDVAQIRSAGHLLRTTHGQIKMTDLAEHCNLSASQFERRFKYYTAVSPKTYARLVRFETVHRTMLVNPHRRPLELAQDFGYSDQAHFIHDFKAFAQCTPGEFASYLQTHFDKEKLHRWQQFDIIIDSDLLTA